jgi:hypothetical protein
VLGQVLGQPSRKRVGDWRVRKVGKRLHLVLAGEAATPSIPTTPLHLLDVRGRTVKQFRLLSAAESIPLDLQPGLYYLAHAGQKPVYSFVVD